MPPGAAEGQQEKPLEKAEWLRVLFSQRSPHLGVPAPLEEGGRLGARGGCGRGAAQSVRTPLSPLVNPPGGAATAAQPGKGALIGNDCSRYTISRGRKTNSNRPPTRQGNLGEVGKLSPRLAPPPPNERPGPSDLRGPRFSCI